MSEVADMAKVLAEVERVLKLGGVFLSDTIKRNLPSRLATITNADDVPHPLPKGTHDPDLFIRSAELSGAMKDVGLEVGPTKRLGPRALNRRGG